MWKVLLVEDEMLIRANLKSMIDWEKNDFLICGECNDGAEAIEKLKYVVPDIIITDIKMKKINGDELTEYMCCNYPQIKIIILSSYSDFQYVKNTMKNHAVDYLLKHQLNPEMLTECLNRCKELLQSEGKKWEIAINLEELRRKFVLNLIAGMYNQTVELIPNYLRNLDIRLGRTRCVAVVMVVSKQKCEYDSDSDDLKQRMVLQTSICNIVQEILQKRYQGICCHVEQQRYILLFSFENVFSWNQITILLKEFMKDAAFCLGKYINCKVKFSAGNECPIEKVSQSYDMALEQLNNGFVKESYFHIYNDYTQPVEIKTTNEIFKLQVEEEKKLNLAIEQENENNAEKILKDIFGRIIENGAVLSRCIILFHELYALFIRYGKDNYIQMEELFYNRDFLDDMLIRPDISIYEIEEYFQGIRRDLFEKLRRGNVTKYSKHVESTLAIIHTRYGLPLTLNEVADKLNLNPSYLSWLFKTEVHVGFSEYLNDYRLEKSRKMLSQNKYDIKEVVEQCGFGGYSYFFNLFKKKYNITPKKYASSYQKGNENDI